MTQAPNPPLPWIAERLLVLRQCVCDALASTHAGPTCWCGIWPGSEVSWEFCGECSGGRCGMGFVRLDGMYTSSGFPLPDENPTCRGPLAYSVEVGALRCLPVADEDGALPDEGALLDSALALTDDALALRQAIDCCFGGTLHAMGEWSAVGPQGGCVGGSWSVIVGQH